MLYSLGFAVGPDSVAIQSQTDPAKVFALHEILNAGE
jgi:hypothetical protein